MSLIFSSASVGIYTITKEASFAGHGRWRQQDREPQPGFQLTEIFQGGLTKEVNHFHLGYLVVAQGQGYRAAGRHMGWGAEPDRAAARTRARAHTALPSPPVPQA